MLRYVVLIAGGCLLLSGCEGTGPKEISGTEPSLAVESPHVDPETGDLIAFWLLYPDNPKYYPQKEKPVLVTEPYAVYLEWLDGVRRFYVYDNVKKRVFGTSDFEAFLKQLGSLPEGIVVQRFDTCCGSQIYDMPAEARERIEDAMQSGTRKWATSAVRGGNREIVCRCESIGFRYPDGQLGFLLLE